jgi:hypothetical protein
MTDKIVPADEQIAAFKSADTTGEIVQDKKDSPTHAGASAAALDAKLTMEVLRGVRALVRAHPDATLEQHVEIVLESIGGLAPDIPEILRLVARRGFEGFMLRAYELDEGRRQ